MRSILHHKEGNIVHHVVFQDAHDRGMSKMSDGTCFLKKAVFIFVGQTHLEHFVGSLSVEIDMFAEVDISEAALSEYTDQAVVCELLAYTVWHGCIAPR